ncbi:cobyric acid synthase, partial [Dietzia schimae]
NSMVVAAPHSTGPHSTSPDGTAEIGRAQWIQALAAGVAPEPAMNPVLLKPGGDRRSHVVVMGQPAGSVSSRDFVDGRAHLAEAAYAAYDDLASRHELVICEGAGSPTEINLRSSDYVNMGLARHADMPVVVVGDIDRGGVFAALYGTVALLEPADQRLVAGFVINKFRGDPTLLAPGLRQIEDLTGRPVHGVLPWNPDLWLDSEDALAVGPSAADATATLRVAVIRLPRISNFTDVDALGLEADVELEYVTEPRDLAGADLVVVPGTRATLDDLAWLRARGLDRALTS